MEKQNPLPTNLDAEQATLGSLLIDPDGLYQVKHKLAPADFYLAKHRLVYEAMLVLHDQRIPFDLRTLADELEGNGHLQDVGGPSFLTGLMTDVPTSAHVEYYADQVRHERVKRELIAAAGEMAKGVYSGNGNLPAVMAQGRSLLSRIEQLLTAENDGMGLRQSLDYYLDILEKRERDKDKPKLEFPWAQLAWLMPHLDSGDLVGLIAEPGVGKTAFLESCAERWAHLGWRVAFFHLELSTQRMLDRRMQRLSGVPIKRLQLGGQLESEDYAAVLESSTRMEHWTGEIQYVACPGWTMARILAMANRLHERQPLDVVIVDYLNKVSLADRGGGMNTAQMRGADIEDLKTALELNGWVGLIAAQFDKAAKRMRNRSLADARDTGELEDKANVGIVIDRPREADSGQRVDMAQVKVVKCNAGQEGMVSMRFVGERLSFYPLELRDRLGGS